MKELLETLKREATRQLEADRKAKCLVLQLTETGLKTIIELEGLDAYELIKTIKRDTPTDKTPFAIVLSCSGWAVNIEDNPGDTPPSEHPKRLRVSVATSQSTLGRLSHVKFSNNKDSQTTDEAQGELTRALDQALKHLTRKHKTHIARTRPEA